VPERQGGLAYLHQKEATMRRPISNWNLLCGLVVFAAATPCPAQDKLSSTEFEKIAEEAYIYGFPLVMNYGTVYEFNVDKASSQYKGPFNHIANAANVFTPADTAVVTPNSDTPYSMLGLDLRAEPYVLSVPEIEKARYYSVQLIDWYTFNFGYIGSRATGNGAGNYLITGPRWKGEKPPGIDKVFACETDFAMAAYRTQLFNPADIDNVRKVQAGYKVQPLSAFLKAAAPATVPLPDFPKFDKQAAFGGDFGRYLNFVLQFCPTVPEEQALRDRLAKIGIAAGKPFDFAALPTEQQEAIGRAIKSARAKIDQVRETAGKDVNGWRMGGLQGGDRAMFKGNWLSRAALAAAGIYANDAVEALYPLLAHDDKGEKASGSHKYTLTFPAGQLPPANAFWSVTMYDGKTQLLVANPINRYLINSPMLPEMKKNEDGSLTLYIQHDSPGKDQEANWLPAPADSIYIAMRLYWPKPEALDGKWQPPSVKRME
jgi:hypothetical protein